MKLPKVRDIKNNTNSFILFPLSYLRTLLVVSTGTTSVLRLDSDVRTKQCSKTRQISIFSSLKVWRH